MTQSDSLTETHTHTHARTHARTHTHTHTHTVTPLHSHTCYVTLCLRVNSGVLRNRPGGAGRHVFFRPWPGGPVGRVPLLIVGTALLVYGLKLAVARIVSQCTVVSRSAGCSVSVSGRVMMIRPSDAAVSGESIVISVTGWSATCQHDFSPDITVPVDWA